MEIVIAKTCYVSQVGIIFISGVNLLEICYAAVNPSLFIIEIISYITVKPRSVICIILHDISPFIGIRKDFTEIKWFVISVYTEEPGFIIELIYGSFSSYDEG